MKKTIMDSEFFSKAFSESVFLLENIQGGIVYSDYEPPFCLRYVTDGMTALSGYSHNELLAMEQMDLVFEDDIETLADEVERQLSVGDTFSVEYRLKRKDGTTVYILDRAKAVMHDDGKKYIHCLLTDINDLKIMEQALLLSNEKYKLAVKQSGNIIIEFSLKDHSLSFSDNYFSSFNGVPPHGTFEEILVSGWVEKPFQEKLKKMHYELLAYHKPKNLELRIKDGNGDYVWCTLHLMAVMTITGELSTLIGCLKNIDKEKKYVSQLKEQTERDGLTSIYNRVTMERIINEHLSGQKDGTLGILDVDYFKQVNDTMGHDYGDKVLIEISRKIESLLPDGTKFGRLGGDEFLIFFPGRISDDKIDSLGQALVSQVHKNFKDYEFPITVSFGLAGYNDNRTNFNAIYKCADMALYAAKDAGRNTYAIL